MSKTVAPLTDTDIRKSKMQRLFEGGGLVLERYGAAHLCCCRPNGKRNRLGLRPYPEVSLAEARKRRDQKEAERKEKASTFAVVAEQWIAKKAEEVKAHTLPESTLRKARLVVQTYLIKALSDCPSATLTSRQAKAAVEKVPSKSPSLAVKARQYLVSIVDFAIEKELREEGRTQPPRSREKVQGHRSARRHRAGRYASTDCRDRTPILAVSLAVLPTPAIRRPRHSRKPTELTEREFRQFWQAARQPRLPFSYSVSA